MYAASTALSMSGFYVLFVWLPHHLRTTGQIERAFLLNVAVMLEWAVCVVGAGYLADRLGATKPANSLAGVGKHLGGGSAVRGGGARRRPGTFPRAS